MKLIGPNRKEKIEQMLTEIRISVESEPQSNSIEQVRFTIIIIRPIKLFFIYMFRFP